MGKVCFESGVKQRRGLWMDGESESTEEMGLLDNLCVLLGDSLTEAGSSFHR